MVTYRYAVSEDIVDPEIAADLRPHISMAGGG